MIAPRSDGQRGDREFRAHFFRNPGCGCDAWVATKAKVGDWVHNRCDFGDAQAYPRFPIAIVTMIRGVRRA
jgi:hypothetical protein